MGAIASVLYVCGFAMRPLTPRILAELYSVGNPFVCGGRYTFAAAFDLLWRTSPHYRAPHECSWYSLGTHLARARISITARRIDSARLFAALRRYVAIMRQDSPSASSDSEQPTDPLSVREAAHWTVSNAYVFSSVFPSVDPLRYIDTPLPILNQLWRAHLVASGRKCDVENESHRLYRIMSIQAARREMNEGKDTQ